MPPQNPTIFGLGVRGRSAAVTAQERVNCYLDVQEAVDPITGGDRSRVTLYGLPGVEQFANLGDTPIRGLASLGSHLYAAHRDALYQIRNDGVSASLGTLDTAEGRVYFANNNDYLALVDGTSGYSYATGAGTFAKITDADFPAAPSSIAFANGYFVVSRGGSEEFHISALDDPTSWPGAFDFAYADPDELVSVFWHQGVLVLAGQTSVEMWGYTGAGDFPFQRVLASQFGWGLAARASLAAIESYGFGLMRRREGGLGVCRLTGGEPELVSPPDLVALLDAYDRAGRVDDAVGASFSIAGHPMYQLTFPAVGATWLYDAMTHAWYKRKTYGLEHYMGVTGVLHQGALYWGDYASGVIWKQSLPALLDDNSLDWSGVVWTDGTDAAGNDRPVVLEAVSEHVHFPGSRRGIIDALELGMETGLGTQTGQGSAPQIALQLSSDRGHSWGAQKLASVGLAGEYAARVRWRRLGQHRDVVFKLTISDPVMNRVITDESVQVRAARS